MVSSIQGNAVIGQSGGCTAVINQSMAGAAEAAIGSKAIKGVWGMSHGVEGLLKGDLIDLRKQGAATLKHVANLPSSALGSSRHKLKEGEEFFILRNLKKWNIRYFFMVGGNDTAESILRIAKAAEQENYDLRAVHIPKTIDNDLMETDHCPGYGSVARFAAIATQEAGLDTKAMQRVDRVKIIEFMGRNSGWIVAAAALLRKQESDPPHILLLPEVPFDEIRFLNLVEKSLSKFGYCIAAISETIRDVSGKRIGARNSGITQDPFGHQYVDGAAANLANLVEARFKVRARFDKPGTIQRMSIPYVSVTDQKEAFLAGTHAVKWALQGASKIMIGFRRKSSKAYSVEYKAVPLEKIPGRERYMDKAFLTPDKTAVTDAFKRYALPLLGPGLPDFGSLKPVGVKLP